MNKAYLSTLAVTNVYQSFYLQDGGKNQLAYRVGQKWGHRLMTIILSNVNRFTNFFHRKIPR